MNDVIEIDYEWLLTFFLRSDLTKKELRVFCRMAHKNDYVFIDTKPVIEQLINDKHLNIKVPNFYKVVNKLIEAKLVIEVKIDNKRALKFVKRNTVDDVNELSNIE